MEVLFPEYFQSVSRIFSYHEKHFNTMELDKTGFFNFFSNISKYFNVFPVLCVDFYTRFFVVRRSCRVSDSLPIILYDWKEIKEFHIVFIYLFVYFRAANEGKNTEEKGMRRL